MSNQVYANSNDPYWLSTRGIDKISFNKLDSPPLAYTNKGILYELDDGKLYFNGQEIATGSGSGDVSGPGSSTDNAAVRWNGTGGDTVQNSTVIIADDGTVTAKTFDATDEVVLSQNGDDLLKASYVSDTYKGVVLGYNCAPNQDMTLITDVLTGNDSFTNYNVDNGENVLIGNSMLKDATNYVYGCVCLGQNVLKETTGNVGTSIVAGAYCLNRATDCMENVILAPNCTYSNNVSSGSKNVIIGAYAGRNLGATPSGDRNIIIGRGVGNNATGDDNILIKSSNGFVGGADNDNCIGIGEYPTADNQIVLGSNTTHTALYLGGVNAGVTPPAGSVPLCIDSTGLVTKMDSLGVFTLNGATIIDGTNQNILPGTNLDTPNFLDAVYICAFPFRLTDFSFYFSRTWTGGESVNCRLIKNANPVTSIATGAWGGNFNSSTPQSGTSDSFSVDFTEGDTLVILINSFTASSNNYMSWVLKGIPL